MLPKTIQDLIEEFSKLPGIGPKTANRLVFYLLSQTDSELRTFGEAVSLLKKNLYFCQKCFNFAESEICTICADSKRDQTKIAVVEDPLDIVALEKTGFAGVYHVLGGVINPIEGISPDDLRVKELLERLEKENLKELILALNPSLEGEATAMYLNREIDKMKEKSPELKKNLKVTRIARGLPVGGELEYADEITLGKALEGRKEF